MVTHECRNVRVEYIDMEVPPQGMDQGRGSFLSGGKFYRSSVVDGYEVPSVGSNTT